MINTDNFSQVPRNFGKTFSPLSEKTCNYIRGYERAYSNFEWCKFFFESSGYLWNLICTNQQTQKVFSKTRNNKWMAPFRSLLNATHDTAGRYSVMLLSCASLLDTMEEIFRYFWIK